MFNAETLVKMLGIDPAVMQTVFEQLATVPQEMEGFKQGFQLAMQHFDAKLTRIEAQQAHILALLQSDKNVSSASVNVHQFERIA